MITLEQPYLENNGDFTRLVCDIQEDEKKKQVFFEVENKWAQYLCYERADAFLIGILNYAMRFKHDIVCKAPVTEELLYNINEYLVPSLAINDSKLYPIKITAPVEVEPMPNAGGVGTGVSCGVDSFHCIHNHYNSQYKGQNLTHLCINSVGSFHRGYTKYGIDRARDDVRRRAKAVADDLGLPLIISNSNIKQEFDIYFEHSHTYYSMFAVYCMQKLWKVYYYASTYTFAYFNLKNSSKKDTAYYELLSLQCFSTHNLRLYSEGSTKDRLEKTRAIVDDKLAQKYLHVCCTKGYNCGTCLKCRRTLLTLDILGKLDDFRESFDIDYYKAHRNEYLDWLYENGRTGNIMLKPIYNALKDEFNFMFRFKYSLARIMHKIFEIQDCGTKVRIRILFIKISYKRKNKCRN